MRCSTGCWRRVGRDRQRTRSPSSRPSSSPTRTAGGIRFRHALLQEAAYQSLPFRQRSGLHRDGGSTRSSATPTRDRVAPLLSLHFLAAQDWERTWRYARLAARVAQEAHAAGEVVVHLERAVAAARRLERGSDEVGTVFDDLGRTLELLGEYERADDAYRQATWRAGGDPLRACAAWPTSRAHLRSEYLGRPSAAIRQLRAGRARIGDLGSEAAGLRALLLAEEADVRERQGRLTDGLECARRGRRTRPSWPASGAPWPSRCEVLNTCLIGRATPTRRTHMGTGARTVRGPR